MAFLGEVELAALPLRSRQDGLACGAQPAVVVADDELDPAQAALDQAVEKDAPVGFGLREGGRDAEDAPPALGLHADGREDGGVAHDAALADLLVSGVKKEIANLSELARSPRLELLVEQGSGPADLGGGQALQAELRHHLRRVARGDALDVHLRDGEHHRARGAPPALQGLGEERLLAAAALGDAQRERAGRRVHGLRLVAVGIAPARLGTLVEPSAEVLLALHPHGEIEERREGLRHALGAGLDELFHQRGDDPIVVVLHPVPLFPERENRNGGEPSQGARPRVRLDARLRAEFTDVRLHHPSAGSASIGPMPASPTRTRACSPCCRGPSTGS